MVRKTCVQTFFFFFLLFYRFENQITPISSLLHDSCAGISSATKQTSAQHFKKKRREKNKIVLFSVHAK